MMDINASLVVAIGLSVVGNIVYNFLKDRNNGKVTVQMAEMSMQMMEMSMNVRVVKERQEITASTLDRLKEEAIKQTSLLEHLVQRSFE